MAVGPTNIGFRLTTIILLFLPGLLALRYYYRRTEQTLRLHPIQVLVYSAGWSLVSLAFVYITSGLYFGTVAGWFTARAGDLGLVTRDQLANLTIPNWFILYGIHVAFALGVAFAAAEVKKRRSDTIGDRREPWHFAFEKAAKDGETIEVGLQNGDIIHGAFNADAWDETQRELYLDEPERVTYEDDGETIDERISLGRNMLITEAAIDQVIFIEEDPETQIIRIIEEYTDASQQTDIEDSWASVSDEAEETDEPD